MMKYYTNEELCKKLEVSISKNITIILQKPIFRGGVPPSYPLRGFGSRRDLRIWVAWVVLDLQIYPFREGLDITQFLHDKINFKL